MFDMSVLFESLHNGTVLTKHEYKKRSYAVAISVLFIKTQG